MNPSFSTNDSQNKESTPFNNEPRIRLVYRNGELIRMVSHVQANNLLRHGFCELLMVKPPTIEFQHDVWDKRHLLHKPSLFRKEPNWLAARRSVMYGNFCIQSPEGDDMFHCNPGKALWYLNRDIVDIVPDKEKTLRFKFQPKGKGHFGDKYYMAAKANQCVVCGAHKDLTRHHVLPRVFRRYLSDYLKDHNYHDILLLCLGCHETYEEKAQELKRQICDEYEISISPSLDIFDSERVHASSAAHTLLKHGHKIPGDRKKYLKGIISAYLKKDEVTDQEINELATADNCGRQSPSYNYGKLVVEKIEDLQAFTERWRQHFIDSMKPMHMPTHWDIKRSVYTDSQRKKFTQRLGEL